CHPAPGQHKTDRDTQSAQTIAPHCSSSPVPMPMEASSTLTGVTVHMGIVPRGTTDICTQSMSPRPLHYHQTYAHPSPISYASHFWYYKFYNFHTSGYYIRGQTRQQVPSSRPVNIPAYTLVQEGSRALRRQQSSGGSAGRLEQYGRQATYAA